ncbi:MAG: hypothetical protein EON50_22100 [Acidovorax sp.]|nr:MAG: hypothetical protein EON50_22100 [Acidovorax sp.]
MKAKKLTARERRANRKETPVSCESINLDPAVYSAALRYLFDRPVPDKSGQEWYWLIDEPEFNATPLQWTHIQTVLFANAGTDLAPYSDEQVGMGLNHVMSNNAGDIPHMVNDPSVPLADAMRMMRALPTLWRDCLGPRLDTGPSPIGSRSDRLYFVSYMWFDVWPTFWNAKDIPEWRDAMWQVFCEMLTMPFRAAQESALHGIGHEGVRLGRPKELQAHMDAFIRQVKHDDELKNYAQAAARGMVQ